MRRISIHALPDSERPRERLLLKGASALSSAELLAIILRTGTVRENVLALAERILAQFDGLKGLSQAAPHELELIDGLGQAKVAQLLAAFEIGRRLSAYQPGERPLITNAAEAAQLVMDMSNLTQEHVRVVLLDTMRRVIAIPTIYVGTLNTSVLRVAETYRDAIVRNSAAIILVHNHPSGDPSPTPEDVEITRALLAAGRLLDIALLDHIIIGHQTWVSLKERGLAFNH